MQKASEPQKPIIPLDNVKNQKIFLYITYTTIFNFIHLLHLSTAVLSNVVVGYCCSAGMSLQDNPAFLTDHAALLLFIFQIPGSLRNFPDCIGHLDTSSLVLVARVFLSEHQRFICKKLDQVNIHTLLHVLWLFR